MEPKSTMDRLLFQSGLAAEGPKEVSLSAHSLEHPALRIACAVLKIRAAD